MTDRRDSARDGARRQLPLWREEVSIHAGEERYVSRRQLGKFLVLTSAAMFAGHVWMLARAKLRGEPAPPPRRRIARAGELRPGDAMQFAYPGPEDDCVLVRTRAGALRAFSQKCTHLSCAVVYAARTDSLDCPCHDGAFAADTGAVLYGPPPRPLPRVRLEEHDGHLWAVGLDAAEPS